MKSVERKSQGKMLPFLMYLCGVVGFVVVCSGIWVAWWGHFQFNYRSDAGLANMGTFLSGTSGALFSLAGFLFVVSAFLAQRIQTRLQENEIEAGKLQFEKQQFESAFFSLLNLHNGLVNGAIFTTEVPLPKSEILPEGPAVQKTTWQGREVFNNLALRFHNRRETFDAALLRELKTNSETPGAARTVADGTRAAINFRYMEFYEKYQSQLARIFHLKFARGLLS